MYRRTSVALIGAAVAILAAAPAGLAKPQPNIAIAITPAVPSLYSTIEVSFTAPRAPKGTTYAAEIRLPHRRNLACTAESGPQFGRARSGRTVTIRLKPTIGDPGKIGNAVWCPGTGRIVVSRTVLGSSTRRVIGRRTVSVRIGIGETAPVEGYVPVKVTVLGGSTLAASATGRPDRSSQLTGVLRGKIPGRFKPTTDVQVEQLTGSLTPLTSELAKAVFPADPLCPGTAPPATFDATAASQMALLASGDAKTNLVLNGAPSQLFGCGPTGPLAGTTTLALTGRVGPNGLLSLSQAGSATGIALPGGSTGGLAASLVLNVDLSGKG